MPVPLIVESVARRFGDAVALTNASLSVERGELLALLGPNGAGKTTLIRSISGRLRLDSGRITIHGTQQVSGGSPEVARHLGVIPQHIALYEDLSAVENLRLFGSVYGVPGSTLTDRIPWILDWTGLTDRSTEPVKNYSGGMKRRLNIGCGVLHEPSVILLDEPTVGVDPQSRARIREMLDRLRQQGASLLLTTHQLEEAQLVADRIAIIDHGKTIAAGTFDELVQASVGSGRYVVLTIAHPSDEVPDSFERRSDRQIARAVEDVSTELPTLLAETAGAGLRVVDVNIESPSLQTVFLHFTGHELRE